MQAFKRCTKPLSRRFCASAARRGLSTTPATFVDPHATSSAMPALPWFVDPSDAPSKPSLSSFEQRKPLLQQQQLAPLPPIPYGVDLDSPIRRLHARLSTSPFLEPGTLLVSGPIPTDIGPPLPLSAPKGKRKRGGTYAGEGLMDNDGGIWQWNVIAQVKEGTENRGGIESVVRIVRQTLLKAASPIAIPPRRKVLNDGWAMIDAGDFAIHIVSKTAREQFFPEKRIWKL